MDELAKLEMERKRAADRVSAVEREWRGALEGSRTASAALAEVERHGGSAPTRLKAEEELAEAKRLADQPWAERLAGAQAAVCDLETRRRAFITEHLAELVGELEDAGEAAAEQVNLAATALVSAHAQWGGIAAQMGALISQVARPSPGDVSYGRPEADEAARGAIALVNVGGERGPRLMRDREPWNRLLGGNDVVEVDDAVPESVPA